MKIYALLMIMLLSIAGCTTTYKGSIKGSANEDGSKSAKDVATQTQDTSAKP
jgi:starvation-inducible outer membrane lipoprotein